MISPIKVAGTIADPISDPASDTREMSETTAARLRQLCDELDEPYDTALNEAQAQKRIAALEEMKAA